MALRSERRSNRLAPEDFVAEAERMTNERDNDAIGEVFAPDAAWTTIIDGVVIQARGLMEIRQRWRQLCRFMRKRQMFVNKRLRAASDTTIVNEWTGSLAGEAAACGIEVWQFGNDGLVTDQRLYGFLDTGADTSVKHNLRLLLSHPRNALAFAWCRAFERGQK
jgi:nuclear transport factor 2 (NTF2) superfamily protein